jgi:hypothetical protein
MVKVENAGVVLRDEQATVTTLLTGKFGGEEALTTRYEVALSVAGTAVQGGLGLIELGGVGGGTGLAGFHYASTT